MRNVIIYFEESKELGLALAAKLNWPSILFARKAYSFGEFTLEANAAVDADVAYIVASITAEASRNFIELMFATDILERANVREIKLIAPYLPFSRQDKRLNDERAVASEVLAKMLAKSGINELITFDLHNDAIIDFYNFKVTHLTMLDAFIAYFQRFNDTNLAVVAPDYGRFRAANYVKNNFKKANLVQINKKRLDDGSVLVTSLVGDVKGKTALIIEDIIDTGNTLKSAIISLQNNGAAQIYIAATHGIFSQSAMRNLTSLKIDGVVVSDTVSFDNKSDKLHVLKIIDIIAAHLRGRE